MVPTTAAMSEATTLAPLVSGDNFGISSGATCLISAAKSAGAIHVNEIAPINSRSRTLKTLPATNSADTNATTATKPAIGSIMASSVTAIKIPNPVFTIPSFLITSIAAIAPKRMPATGSME